MNARHDYRTHLAAAVASALKLGAEPAHAAALALLALHKTEPRVEQWVDASIEDVAASIEDVALSYAARSLPASDKPSPEQWVEAARQVAERLAEDCAERTDLDPIPCCSIVNDPIRGPR